MIDQNGTTRLFARDNLGRLLTDSVSLPLPSGSAVDTAAAVIKSTYDTHGRVSTVETLTSSSAVLNKVTYEYDALGGVKELKQVAGYSGSTPLGGERAVKYDLATEEWIGNPSGVSGAYLNNWRGVRGISYPDGSPADSSDDTELRYYADADQVGVGVGELTTADTDAFRRFAIAQPTLLALRHAGAYSLTGTITDVNPGGVKLLASVRRLGIGRTVSMSLDVPQVHLDRVRSTTGRTATGVYHGWDRFGRLKQQVWASSAPGAPIASTVNSQREYGWLQDTSSSPTYPEVRPVYQHTYSYSPDSDRLSDDDLRPTLGGGSGSAAATPDRKYTYDNLRRLTKEEKGKFSWSYGTLGFTAGAGSRSWTLDMLGNWKSVATDENGDGTFAAGETSTRTHDGQNQLLSMGATTAGGGGGGTPEYVRAYDKNGNLITETIAGEAEPVRRYVYDAWNRLVRVDRGPGGTSEPAPVASYSYNALNWRTVERVRWPGDAGDETPGYTRTRVFFFSSDWQVLNVLEDRHVADSGATPPVTLPTEAATGIVSFGGDSETQFMWGVRDKDELLQVRTRALTDAGGTAITPITPWTSSLVNTVYALTDAQLSIAGYVNSGGRIRETRVFDSYGRMTRCLPGDLNGDGVCDDTDFGIFDASYNLLLCDAAGMPGSNGGPGGNPPTWGCPADLNGDWQVDDADFLIFAASYNQLIPDVDALATGNSSGGALEWGPGWNGYWFDPATGLWLSRNRWYDPMAGRWITRDPAGYVDGLSLYLYVKGNPFLFRDPSGLEAACMYSAPPSPNETLETAKALPGAVIGTLNTAWDYTGGALLNKIFKPRDGSTQTSRDFEKASDFATRTSGPNSIPAQSQPLPGEAAPEVHDAQMRMVREGAREIGEQVDGAYGSRGVQWAMTSIVGGKIVKKLNGNGQSQLSVNKANGKDFENKVINDILPNNGHTDVTPQVTVRTNGPGQVKVRLDAISHDSSSAIKLTEAKASQTAPLTANQSSGFPELASFGGTVVGEGKSPFVGGTVIPPTPVDIIRKP